MSAKRLSLVLSVALAASPGLALADGHAHHSSGGSGNGGSHGNGSGNGGGHPPPGGSHAVPRTQGSGGSGSQYRHPQAGTGTGYRYGGHGHGYGYGYGHGYYPYYGYRYGYGYPYWGWGGGLYYYGGYPYYSYDDGYYAEGAGGYYSGPRSYSRASGAVRLLVEPDDAKVYVDGYYSGVVDDYDGFSQRLYLPAGKHEILLRRDGYQSQRFKVYVTPDNTLKIHYTMEKGTGDAAQEVVVGDPSAEQYARDDRRRSEDADRDADRDRDGRDRPADRPRPHRDAVAPVHLNVKPDDASVYVDGRFYGTAREANRLQLTPGRHRVEVVRPGYRTYDHDIDVGTDSPADLDVTLER